MSGFLTRNRAALLLGAAVCSTAAALVWTSNGSSAATPAACTSTPTSSTVGYTTGGTVGAVTATPAAPQPTHAVRHARRKTHAKRHAVAGPPPGQMPPYIHKGVADPACVPTPAATGTAGTAPATP